jgi:hypothetical protein
MALHTGVEPDRAMDELLIPHPFVTYIAGVILVRHITYLFIGRLHVMTRSAERFGVSPVEGGSLELLGDLPDGGGRRVVNLGLETLQLLPVSAESLHGQLVDPFIPERLKNKKITEGALVLVCPHRQGVAGNAIDGDDNPAYLLRAKFEDKMTR